MKRVDNRKLLVTRGSSHSMRMVNAEFPDAHLYGFEMVDVPLICLDKPSIENLHRIKTSGFFANFRIFNLNANTCDLSTAVSQERLRDRSQENDERRPGLRNVLSASHGILARAGARAVAQGQ